MTQADHSRSFRYPVVMALALSVLFTAGCGMFESGPSVPDRYEPKPPPRDLPQRSKKALLRHIENNARKFKTLTASCEVVIMSPLIRQTRGKKSPRISGSLYLKKPGKIHLQLYSGGQRAVELTGNGNAYQVNMPLIGDSRYSGEYGSPIRFRPNRVHFMPDDLADCLDRTGWFGGKMQVMRALKEPAEWHIDNLVLQTNPEPSLNIVSSIQMDRRNQHVVEFSKYAEDGTVRCKAWFRNVQLVQTGDRSVRVPSTIWMRYPMEGTWIGLQLDSIELNTEIKPEHFTLD